MRTIDRATKFKRDYKRESKGPRRQTLDDDLAAVIQLLLTDQPLPAKFRDHALSGVWKDFRDCHVRPDLVLIYRKLGLDFLQLARLGSHSELGF
ncbi:MAG TPA: type II toxin-antitoxin system YafQ family toxin [Rhizomicrobium sp.]|jgi:mRNA interferase YafQ|nr:type II toxin-antitoxin system YafQ family toxin [Rhizomicrobium sp.]